jgi:hypothetical protein
VPRCRLWAVFPLDRAIRPRPTPLSGHSAWQAAAPPGAVAPNRIGPNTVRRFKNSFSNLFNPKNGSKLLEFIENCRNVQKLQTKFYWNYLEKLYRVGLIKLIFVQ